MCYHFLLQGIFPSQGSNLCLLHWQVDSLPLSHQGSPVYLYTCVHVCSMFCVWNIAPHWGVGLNAKCPEKAGSPGTVFIFFFLKASIGSGKQGDELRKSGSRAGWDLLLTMDTAAPGQTQQVCQRYTQECPQRILTCWEVEMYRKDFQAHFLST